MKRKIGMIGYFATGKSKAGGQEAKTCAIADELDKVYGPDQVLKVDTLNWKRHPLRLLFNLIKIGTTCQNAIMLPAQNSLPIFASALSRLKRISKCKIHYVAVGGWLPEFVENKRRLKKALFKFDGIYVQANAMKEALEKQRFRNVLIMHNFRDMATLEETDLVFPNAYPLPLCTFSRVIRAKGIGDAVSVVRMVNEKLGYEAFSLDIYGAIGEKDKEWFASLKEEFPSYISYKGVFSGHRSSDVLKNYYALLFPTYYQGEGFAGTLLDAYSSGLPVIASDWRYNKEFVNERVGIVYPTKDNEALERILLEVAKDPSRLLNLRKNCLEEAKRYTPQEAMGVLLQRIED